MAGLLDSLGMGAVDPNALAAVMPNPTINAPPSLLQRIAGGLGTFGNGLNTALTNNPLLDMGLGIMASAGQLGGGVGAGALQGMQAYRQQQAAQLQQQQLRQQLLMNQLYFRGLLDPQMLAAMGISSPGASSTTGAAPSASAQGSGGLLGNAPAAPAFPAVTPAPYLPPTPSAVGQSAQGQGVPGQPQSSAATPGPSNGELPSSLPNPWELYQRGVTLQRSPISQYQATGKAFIQQANAILQNDPRYVTQRAAAASLLDQDQFNIQQAQVSGDPIALNAAQMKYLTDAKMVNVANNNNAVTTFGLTPAQLQQMGLGINASNPGQGTQTVNGVQSPIPGAPLTQRALAGARAQGEAQGELVEQTDPTGSITGQPGGKYYVTKSSLLGASPSPGVAGRAALPGAVLPARAPIAAQGPEAAAQQAAAGTTAGEELGELNKNAEAARQANYTLDQLRQLGRGASLGPAAPAREWFEQVATPLAQLFGAQPPKELATYEQINKFGNTLAFNAARAMGSREAAQIVQLQIESNPNKGLVPDAYNGLISSMSALNDYVIAKNGAVQAAATGGQISARQAIANWETNVDPKVWDLAISPQLAQRFAGQIGVGKIAKTLPFMASDDAVSTMRNISLSMQSQVLRGLPTAAKQEILSALQATVQSGATGTF